MTWWGICILFGTLAATPRWYPRWRRFRSEALHDPAANAQRIQRLRESFDQRRRLKLLGPLREELHIREDPAWGLRQERIAAIMTLLGVVAGIGLLALGLLG